jgi:hypothetical protein
MLFTLEVLDFGEEDNIAVLDELEKVFDNLELTGSLYVNKKLYHNFGYKGFLEKARVINSILKERTPYQLREEFYTADILIDVMYSKSHIEIYGVRLADPSDIDYFYIIQNSILTYFEDGKEILHDVKEGKIYNLHTGNMIQKFYIKKGKISFRKGKK